VKRKVKSKVKVKGDLKKFPKYFKIPSSTMKFQEPDDPVS